MERFSEYLLQKGLVHPVDVAKARKYAQTHHMTTEEAIFELKIIPEETFLKEYSKVYKIPYMENISDVEYVPDFLPIEFMDEKGIIIIEKEDDKLTILKGNPFDYDIDRELEFITNMKVESILAPPEQIKSFISKYSGVDLLQTIEINEEGEDNLDSKANTFSLKQIAEQPPIIRLVNIIFIDAIKNKASDIHIEPQKNVLLVRFRLDGHLHIYTKLKPSLASAISSRIKIMANLDISERRKPQDGSISLNIEGKEVDLRVSMLPSLYGEKTVIRILDKSNLKMSLKDLGFADYSLEKIERIINKPHGIILVSGPTGSGKSTTLYSIINELKSEETNIVTIEDPVEYKLDGITQISVNTKTGLTFAAALRSILRQDPDIILLGEIRDEETAKIAVNAALTGHLVLSTIHTNNAVSVIPRFQNMGVYPDLIADAIVGIIAQRLARKVCKHCFVEETLSSQELKKFGIKGHELTQIKGQGCKRCMKTGYKGRTLIEEVLEIDEDFKALITEGFPRDKVMETLKRKKFIPMSQNGIEKVIKGITTIEEVASIANLSNIDLDKLLPSDNSQTSTVQNNKLNQTENNFYNNPQQPSNIPNYNNFAPNTPSFIPNYQQPYFPQNPNPNIPLQFPNQQQIPPNQNIPSGYSQTIPNTNARSILIVDDSPTIRAMVKPLFEMKGFIVYEAEHGRDALEKLKYIKPSLIIIDLMMPYMNGFETVQIIRQTPGIQDIPIIMMTTESEMSNELTGFNLGIDEFIAKPFMPERLLARAMALLRRSKT